MLDPTRFALDAQTVGFRKRTLQSVDWDAFNEALQTQTDSVKVRRELEETPISEIHVMGGQRFGIEGNAKTNEIARQHRQINGYVLRSFLATGGPVILPPKKNDSLLGIPTRFGQIQYTPNAVMSEQYTSAFTEPLNAPLENNTILLGRAGLEAKSNSISNPYAALQFRLNMDASQEEIRAIEAQHQQLKSERTQDLEREKLKGYKEVPAHLLGVHRSMKKKPRADAENTPSTANTSQIRRDKEQSRNTPFTPKRVVVEEQEAERELRNVNAVEEEINAQAVNVEKLSAQKQIIQDLLTSDPDFKAMAEVVQAQTHVDLIHAGNSIMQNEGNVVEAIAAINDETERSVSASTESSADISKKNRLSDIFRTVEYSADDMGADSVINFNTTTELAVNKLAEYSNKKAPKTPTVGKSTLKLRDGGFNSGPSSYSSVIQRSEVRDGPDFGPSPQSVSKVGRFSLEDEFTQEALQAAKRRGSLSVKRGSGTGSSSAADSPELSPVSFYKKSMAGAAEHSLAIQAHGAKVKPYGSLPLTPSSKGQGVGRQTIFTPKGNKVPVYDL